jgi:hypothetical protein
MRSHPANAIPPDLQHAIAPQQVWTHLSEGQQQAVRDALIQIVGTSLQSKILHNTQGKNSDECELNQQ